MKSIRQSKLALLVALVTFVTATLIPTTIFAKGGGGGGRSSGGSFSSSRSFSSSSFKSSSSSTSWSSRSTSGGIFKSTTTTTSTTTTSPKPTSTPPKPVINPSAPTKQAATGSAGAKPTVAPLKTFTGGSAFDKKGIEKSQKERSAASLASYRTEQAKFKEPPKTTATSTTYQSSTVYQNARPASSYNDYYSHRDNYWRNQSYSPPTTIVYGGQPSFGMWDAFFMYSLLNASNHNNAQFAYHHQDDPGYRDWRRQAEEQAKTNEKMREQLADLDKQVAVMKTQGVKKDTNYLPPGVPAEVAISADAALAKKIPLRLATGRKGGIYHWYAEQLVQAAEHNFKNQKAVGLDIKIIPTAGSVANKELLEAGQADVVFMQGDVIAMKPLTKANEQKTVYEEVVQLVGNRNSGVKSIKDLDKTKHTVYIGPEGSGTAQTWKYICDQDSFYKDIKTENMSYEGAFEKILVDPTKFAMFVGGLHSDFMNKANEKGSGKLRLIEFDDSDFNSAKDKDGNKVFTFVEIPGSTYPNLQKYWWFFKADITTLAVPAVSVMTTEWLKQYGPAALDALTLAMAEAKPALDKKVYGISH